MKAAPRPRKSEADLLGENWMQSRKQPETRSKKQPGRSRSTSTPRGFDQLWLTVREKRKVEKIGVANLPAKR